jgi:hypothetical protein
MPAAGDQAAEGRMAGGILIDMEWLRVELAGKADDIGLGQCDTAELPDAAYRKSSSGLKNSSTTLLHASGSSINN